MYRDKTTPAVNVSITALNVEDKAGCWSQLGTVMFLLMTLLISTAAFAQSYSWKNVDTSGGGGFVPGIVFNPSQKNLIYVRTDIGGAYRWDAVNSRWIPLMDWVGFDDWNTMGVESIATDPVDANRFYVAAGTYTNSFTTANGAILRSTDQGNTFQRTNLPFKLGGNMPGRSMGERLVIDPNQDSILFFGARSGNGLWKSTDFGATWNKVTSFNDEGVKLSNTGAITSLSLTISIQATSGVTFSGQYNTVGGQIAQSHSSTASAITYQYTLSPGQTLSPGTNWLFAAQAGGAGAVHPTSGDTFTVTYTTGGASFTQSGHF